MRGIRKGLFTEPTECSAIERSRKAEVPAMRHLAAVAVAALFSTAAIGFACASDGETPATAPAHVEKTFLVPASDGYGVGECLTGGNSPCGQVVANAWCESQGFASAASYGTAAQDEYTGAIDGAVAKAADRPVRITCQD